MAFIHLGSVSFDADLVAFDKDGTLIDFEDLWGTLAAAWVERMAEGDEAEELRQELYRTLGYDWQRHRAEPEGPLAIATNQQLQTVAAAMLYRRGMSWPQADERARSAWDQVTADLSVADMVRPAGDVHGLLAALKETGVHVAVITTDERAVTEETLRLLGVAPLVDSLYCGDDEGIVQKPAPDALLAACEQLDVATTRVAVVGDTVGDLLMGRRANAGLCAGVLSGAGDRQSLGAHADVLLRSIDDIRVGEPESATGEQQKRGDQAL